MAHLDIIDPIHDFVRVYDNELKIIDTPIFQRLRRIRQLSGAHLIYPGAQPHLALKWLHKFNSSEKFEITLCYRPSQAPAL